MGSVIVAIAILMSTVWYHIMANNNLNAYENDISKCLFDYWPTNVLSAGVSCSGSQLCYSKDGFDNKKKGKDTEAQFVSCYNTHTLIPDFTAHVLHDNPPRPSGRTPNFHNDIGKYAPKPQASVDKKGDYRVELQKDLKQYPNFDASGRKEQYCARGHLTPAGDFATRDERALTYISTNVAPQWQPFNGGNWKTIEEAVRDYHADKHSSNPHHKLYIFTGTAGFGTTLHGNKIEVKLNNRVFAPKYYWKVVCDPEAPSPTGASSGGQSVVIMALNNIGDISTNDVKTNWDPAKLQTEKRGVIELYSLQDANAKSLTSLPSLGSKCNPDKRGTFLDRYITTLQ